MMLSPDLLDRRALAWLRPLDVYGRPVTLPMQIHGAGVTSVRKDDGTIAILAADDLDDYSASFLTPSSPAVGSKHLPLDVEPASREIGARRFDLRLPRDADPAKSDQDGSIFLSVPIEILPGPAARLTGSACALRATVRRKSDKKLIENALVRAQSEDGQFSARGLTDARGEATLIFPSLPLAFPGAGAKLRPDTQASVVVTVDSGSARFNTADPTIPSFAIPPFVDPDELGSVPADFGAGTRVPISAGRDIPLALEWTKP